MTGVTSYLNTFLTGLELADAVLTDRKLLNNVDRKWFEEVCGREVSSDGIFEEVVNVDEGRDEGQKLFFSWWNLDELRTEGILEPVFFSVGEWVLICIGVVLGGMLGMYGIWLFLLITVILLLPARPWFGVIEDWWWDICLHLLAIKFASATKKHIWCFSLNTNILNLKW